MLIFWQSTWLASEWKCRLLCAVVPIPIKFPELFILLFRARSAYSPSDVVWNWDSDLYTVS